MSTINLPPVPLEPLDETPHWRDWLSRVRDTVLTKVTYVLPTSTTKLLGGVRPDGTSISVDTSGVISKISAYGEMVIDNSVVGVSIANAPTYTQYTTGFVAGDLKSFTFNSGVLTCHMAGTYFTTCSVSCSSTSSNQIYRIGIAHNGSIITDHLVRLKLINSTDVTSATIIGVVAGVNAGDTFDLRATDESGTQTLTIGYANFSMFLI